MISFSPLRTRRALLQAALVLLAGALLTHARAQLTLRAPGFRLPIYAKPAGEDSQPQLRALITGGASIGAGLSFVVRDMVITSFAPNGATNAVARAVECLINQADNTAISTNQLQVDGGQGQFQISGRGFLLNLADSTLFLSNDVRTIIEDSFLQTARGARPATLQEALQIPPPSASTNGNPPLLINSDSLSLIALSNLVTYQGAVHVRSAQADLRCDTLVLERATNGAISKVAAHGNVVVQSHTGAGAAYGDHALYTTASGAQLLSLTGAPARWEDGPRQGQAQLFILDLQNNILQAEQRAFVRLPRQGLEKQDWILAASPSGESPSTNATNPMVSVSAELLTLHLPTELRPGHSVLAQTNVLIISEEDGSRASADQAFYAEVTGTLELNGNASWNSEDRVIRAHSLFLDRSNQTFRASGDAYLHLPVGALARHAALPQLITDPAAPNPSTALEIYCARYAYRDGELRFQDEVRANLTETNRVTTRLTCQELIVHGTKRLDQAHAIGNVRLEQVPLTLPHGAITQRMLDCEWLALLIDTNGQPQRIIARTNVLAAKYELSPNQPDPVWTRLHAEEVTADFMPGTNQFKRVLAERNVIFSQGPRTAYGQTALLENNLVSLTGAPSLDAPEGKITEASAINFDLSLNRFYVQQGRAQGAQLPGLKLTPPR